MQKRKLGKSNLEVSAISSLNKNVETRFESIRIRGGALSRFWSALNERR
jgi:hypothetical protein